MDTVTGVRIRLGRVQIRRWLLVLGLLNLIFLAGTAFGPRLAGFDWRLDQVVRAFHLGRENGLAAWYASMLLLTAGCAMLMCYAVDVRERGGTATGDAVDRALSVGWVLLAGVFVLLSWDELGSFHERLGHLPFADRLAPPTDVLSGWAGRLVVPAAIVALGMLAFGWVRVRRSGAAFLLMTAAVLLYVSVPLQEHLQVTYVLLESDDVSTTRPALHLVAEEGAELFGTLLFLAAGLVWARHVAGSAVPKSGDAPAVTVPLRLPHVLALGALLGLGLLSLYAVVPELTSPEAIYGHPQNWFPAVLALGVSAVCFALAREAQRGRRAPLVLLGVLHLALSADHGSDHVWQDVWLASERFVPMAVQHLLIVSGIVVLAVWTIRRVVTSRSAGAWVTVWAILLALSTGWEWGHEVARIVSACCAYVALLGGLTQLNPAFREAAVIRSAPRPRGPAGDATRHTREA